ncbi:aminotransferase class I/II-fold pyridoxal phosphate-dependent enzyme [Eupransor demetentiae]|uniref:Aminotransferase n=1 Tax=Eupransor demetentiae TaxID=3109584 RepID=A0ABM9N6M2_9LACO|nr:Aspartate/methionine/tyrosine aminotransferase (AspB) [Lactobacillaceae bacterium LMG 33000]
MPDLLPGLQKSYNHRLDLVQPSGIRAFDQKISEIDGIIKLTIGEPDLNTPEHIKEAAIQAIKNNDTHYSAQPGTLALRKAIANYLAKSQGLDYKPEDEIIVTIGATEALYASFATLLNPGDQVILPTPTFALYEPIVTSLGGEVINLDTSANGFVLEPEQLRQALEENDRVKAVLLNYPGNPTGIEYDEAALKKIADVLKDYPVFVLTDEIYAELNYSDEPHFSIAKLLPQQSLYINGLSKSHAMTGWRIGYVAGPAEIMNKIRKNHAFMVTCPSDIDQAAAQAALEDGQEDPIPMRAIYQKRRDFLYKSLTDLGFDIILPQGAFYMFAKLPDKLGTDDTKAALAIAEKAKVGVIPGSAFGPGGEGYIRFSYAASDANLKEAVERLSAYLKQA